MFFKSFQIEPLTKDADFFSDAERAPTIVEGSGQKVYWRGCWIAVYSTGNTKEPKDSHDVCDGEGTLQKGTSLVFVGDPKFGRVKTEKTLNASAVNADADMSTKTYRTLQRDQLSKEQLEDAAKLFSRNYGIWGPQSTQPGTSSSDDLVFPILTRQ